MTLTNPNQSDVLDMLSPQQSMAFPMLAAGESAKAVAEKLDVTPQTISQWLNHDEEFRYALWCYRKEALDAARSELQLAATEAVTVVRKLLHNGSTENVRLKAAQLLLDRLGLVGQYSKNGFDGAAVTPIGNYEPPRGPDPQVEKATRVALEILNKFRRRRALELGLEATGRPDGPTEESPGETD